MTSIKNFPKRHHFYKLKWISVHIGMWSSFYKERSYGGAWVAQSVKRPTLDFGSVHDLRVMRLSPLPPLWAPWSAGSLLEILSLTLPLPIPTTASKGTDAFSLSLSQK